MSDILSDLNPKQREAVETINGPVLVIAGPGSGKTKILTHRVAHLIQQGIAPDNILAVTFTNKAAQEMKERIKNLLSVIPAQAGIQERRNDKDVSIDSHFHENDKKKVACFPTIGTFHSVCARILRAEAPQIDCRSDFVIYDENDSLSLIKKCFEELEIGQQQFKPRSIQEAMSSAKNNLLSPPEYAAQTDSYYQEIAAKIYALY
jgi:DNA helicase-2/ATP-dependent DNA helicase PcrA